MLWKLHSGRGNNSVYKERDEERKISRITLQCNGNWEEENWEVGKDKAIFEEVLQGVEGESHALQAKRS